VNPLFYRDNETVDYHRERRMIVHKLICEEWEEVGKLGWLHTRLKPLGFDPSLNNGIPHDIIEHGIDDIGGAEGEFMAFGAACWGRGEGGWFYKHSRYVSFEKSFKYEFPEILAKIVANIQTLKDPGRTLPLRDWDHWNEKIIEIINSGVTEYCDSGYLNYGTKLSDIPISYEETCRRILGWMRKGFRRSAKYWGRYHRDASDVCHIYEQIGEIADKNVKGLEEGEELIIRINPWTADVTYERRYTRVSQW
jgi:hypothetical protein